MQAACRLALAIGIPQELLVSALYLGVSPAAATHTVTSMVAWAGASGDTSVIAGIDAPDAPPAPEVNL